MGDHIQQAQEMIDHQAHEQEMKRQEVQKPRAKFCCPYGQRQNPGDGLIFIRYSQFRIAWMDCDSNQS